MPPGSDYAQPDEQTLTLSDAGVLTDENGTSMNKIEFTLAKVDSYVTGSLIDKDTNQSISGLVGEVYAMRTDGDGWQYAPMKQTVLIPCFYLQVIGWWSITWSTMIRTVIIQKHLLNL